MIIQADIGVIGLNANTHQQFKQTKSLEERGKETSNISFRLMDYSTERISFCCFKPPRVQYFVMAVLDRLCVGIKDSTVLISSLRSLQIHHE